MKKHQVGLLVDKNAFVDEGDGVVSFPQGLVITDDSEQRNGTKYDIETLDISEYQGQLTADHVDNLDKLIAGVEGVEKVGAKVVVKKINYLVKESPLARLAYNLLINPKVPTNFSIETIGPWPSDEDDTYYKAKLVGLSQVVLGNNRNAKLNAIFQNSIKQSKEDGLDTEALEDALKKEIQVNQNHTNDKEEQDMKFKTIKNSRDFAVKVSYKNAAGEDTETELAPNAGVDVSEDQAESVEKQLKDAENKVQKKEDNSDALLKAVNAALDAKLKPVTDKLEKIEKAEQEAFDKSAKEPEFIKQENAAREYRHKKDSSEFAAMDWEDRTVQQIEAARLYLVNKDIQSLQKWDSINRYHMNKLKEDGKVKNAITMSDFGNFVTSPELLGQIEGCRNNYQPLLQATTWRETLSLDMSWLERDGDIEMSDVEFCDDGADGNLKPISDYNATPRTDSLKESAAVTPICNAATRFVAVDLLGDVAEGYRNAYDKKRAQMVIARIEQAIEYNGNSVVYDVNPAEEGLISLVLAWKEIANCTPNGTFIFNMSSFAEIMAQMLRAGANGPLAGVFTTGEVQSLFGRPYIVVPDDLMPSLNSAGTKTFTIDGVTVTVNHAVMYADLSKFTGRISGGLNYTLSTEAAYESSGVVKSAFQRDELLVRGYFYRGAAFRDRSQASGILAPGVS
jgi:hypothetical protein